MTSALTGDWLGRIARRAVIVTAVLAVAAAVVPGGGWRMAAGVVGGAAVSFVSFWAIRRGVAGLGSIVTGVTGVTDADAAPAAATNAPPRAMGGARTMLVVFGRYALLAGMAYVMIARLRLHPLGLLGGASAIPIAAALEFVTGSRGSSSRRG